jgi:hypothetical protein
VKNKRLTVLTAILLIGVLFLIPGLPKPVDAVATIYGAVHYLNDLLDVNATAPLDNQSLTWDNTTGMWVARNVTAVFSCSDLNGCNLTDIGDINISAPADGWIVYWNNTSGYWEARNESIFTCGDLDSCTLSDIHGVLVTPTSKWIIYYNIGTSRWESQALSNWDLSELGNKNITDLDDVNAPAPNDNDILFWNNTAGEWQTKAESGFSCSDLNTCNISELADVNATSPSDGDFLSYSVGLGYWQGRQLADTDLPTEVKLASITFIIDGVCAAIAPGEKGHLEIPFNCTIQRVTMEADQTGSIAVDIWKDTYANFPPTNADSITSATPPTITTAQKSQDSALTNWTTSISAGDILAYNVDSCSNITRVTVSLKAVKI